MEGCAADISLSHCSGLAVCAISFAGRVGIDAEIHQPIDPADFASVFDDAEMDVVLRALSPARMAIQLWTIKEAVLKADGKGFLHSDPRTISVLSSQVRCGGNIWSISELECGHEWTCCLASTDPFPIVQMETRHY